jgi:hypothetical protein
LRKRVNEEQVTSVLDEAAFGGTALLEDGRDSGSAFVLDEKAKRDAIADAGDGWTVEVRSGNLVVVARGSGVSSAEEAHSLGLGAAQRGLDLLSIRGKGDLLIQRAEDENLAWWRRPDGTRVLRATSIAPLRMAISAEVGVFDASGKEKPVPPEPEPTWHPSFRYFRLAQVSEEVFGAYRNLYLALESILSEATPKHQNEGERDWTERALRAAAAAGLDLAPHAPSGASDPVVAIRQDLYSDARTATFHAKVTGQTLVPLDPIDRRAITERLSRLAGLYLGVVAQTLGVRRASGAIMKAGFDLMIGGILPDLAVHVTDDAVRFDEAATSVNPGGGRVQEIPTRPYPEFDQPFLRTIIGETPLDELRELRCVSRIVSVHPPDGTPIAGGQLEAQLTLGGFDLFEAVMAIRGLNVQLPRTFYSA